MSASRRQAAEWLRLYRDLGVEAVALHGPAVAESGGGGGSGGAAEALERLREETLGDCRRCALWKGRTRLVFGTGNPEARLVFVGEGPGADEDRQGEPFVGKAGRLLDKIIGAMGLSREEVYIANVVKCRPPENRAPLPDESATCLPFLHEQIRIIQPEVIVTLGRTALEGLLGEPVRSITRARGRWFRVKGVPVMATFHPAYLLRNPAAKRPVWEDMQEVLARLGLSPPPRQGR
ncbi:MAG: uracil-DNA glycosylase [Acidobacteriota bacterium]|nr:uracil-DNA glycosylase [Acidobacteriota bacterium]